jgi:hypothetical protein
MSNSGSAFSIGLPLGTAIGLTVGSLFAPRPRAEKEKWRNNM